MEQKRVWIYCRLGHADACGMLENQKVRLCRYAKAKGLLIEGITSECGSGTSLSRKGLNEVFAAAQVGRMDFLLIANTSRIGRDAIKTIESLNRLKAVGVDTISDAADPHISDAERMMKNIATVYPTGLCG